MVTFIFSVRGFNAKIKFFRINIITNLLFFITFESKKMPEKETNIAINRLIKYKPRQ